MATPPSSVAPDSSTFDELTSWLQSSMAQLNVPGGAVGVVIGNQRFTHASGVINADTGEAFTPSTRFGIASLTKIFTATAVALMSHDGLLSLDDAVTHHLPDFNLSEPDATSALTVGHLLSHAGGWADVLEPVPGQDALLWYASQMDGLPQIAPVGTNFSYSNSAFMLAGAVIEHLTGAPYEDAIIQAILQPLGMSHSGFAAGMPPSNDQASGHEISDEELAVIPIAEAPRAANPVGGLLSTVGNMLTFVAAHAAIDLGGLNAEALASMRQPRNAGGAVGPVVVDNIGTGWMLLDIDGETVLMSQGGDSGLISAMIAIPSRQFGIVVLANCETAMMLVNDAVLRGMSLFTGLALPEPETYILTSEEGSRVEGQFGLPEWMTFAVTSANGSIQVAASAGGHEIPDLSGRFTMTSPTRGYMPYPGGHIWLDLVPDQIGAITWLRFAARLLPRMT